MNLRLISLFVALIALVACSAEEGTEVAGESATPEEVAVLPIAEVVQESEDDRVNRVHSGLVAIDTHIDIPFEFATDEFDPGITNPDRQVDLPGMREGGLHVGYFIVFMPQTERTPENYAMAIEQARTKFDAIHRMTDQMYPEQIELAYSAGDVLRIREQGKLVAMIGIENGYGIGPDLSLLQEYADLGARYITLAHVGHNDIADSSMPREDLGDVEEEHGGVSEFGREVIAEMNRTGITVDVSHISKNAMLQATTLSRAAVMGSHSGVSALHDHPRNMDDEQLLALKENGGVIQVVAFDSYLQQVAEEKREALRALFDDLGIEGPRAVRGLETGVRAQYDSRVAEIHAKWPRASVSTLVDHIDYAVNLIGIDHVGVSSDFQGGGGIDGWNHASETRNVTAELLHRGYSEEDIGKIWGGNLLRVLRDVERVSRELNEDPQG